MGGERGKQYGGGGWLHWKHIVGHSNEQTDNFPVMKHYNNIIITSVEGGTSDEDTGAGNVRLATAVGCLGDGTGRGGVVDNLRRMGTNEMISGTERDIVETGVVIKFE